MWLECAVALVHQIVIHCFLVECASLRVSVCACDCIPPSVFLWLWELCQLCIVSSLYELCVYASSFAKRQLTRRRCSCEADSPSHILDMLSLGWQGGWLLALIINIVLIILVGWH